MTTVSTGFVSGAVYGGEGEIVALMGEAATLYGLSNPLHPDRMTAHERRAELCRLLALGLIRLRQRDMVHLSDGSGESSLHYPANQSVHATPTHRRTA